MKTQETVEEAAERLYPTDYGEKSKNIINIIKQEAFIRGAKWQQEQNDTSKVTRVEVIQHSLLYNGRAYTNCNAKDVEIQFQDDDKTLKIFVK